MPPGPGNLKDARNSIHYITVMGSSLRIEFSWSPPEYFAPGSVVCLYVEFCVAYPGLIRNFHISPWRLSLTSPVFFTGLSIRPGKLKIWKLLTHTSRISWLYVIQVPYVLSLKDVKDGFQNIILLNWLNSENILLHLVLGFLYFSSRTEWSFSY